LREHSKRAATGDGGAPIAPLPSRLTPSAPPFNRHRFCYHQRLSIAGNCRMCLVEVSILSTFE
jgi:hypothetical protein